MSKRTCPSLSESALESAKRVTFESPIASSSPSKSPLTDPPTVETPRAASTTIESLGTDGDAGDVLAPPPSGDPDPKLETSIAMRLSVPKRDFLRFISGGFHMLFACSYEADEIGEGRNDDDEDAGRKWIRENLLSTGESMAGTPRYWFNEDKYCDRLKGIKTRADEDLMIEALINIGELDMPIGDAFNEACVTLDEFQEYVGQGAWTEEHQSLFLAFRVAYEKDSKEDSLTHREFMDF
jgi:hypothetical protein